MSYFLLYGVFGLWVLFDSLSRRMGPSAFLWALGTAIVGPLTLPVYLALRPLKQGEVREGGTPWNIFKNFAILWTIAMAIATAGALIAMAGTTTGLTSIWEQAGAGIGTLVVMGILAAAWFFPAIGAALVGFLLKKNTVIETGPTGALIGQSSAANPMGGWVGLTAAAFLGLIVVGSDIFWVGLHKTAAAAAAARAPELSPASSSSVVDKTDWVLVDTKDQMDNTPIVSLEKAGPGASSLVIRCQKRKTFAYVITDTVVDNGSVRIKFDESPPLRQAWSRSTDYKALFAPDAVTFARKLTKAHTFLIEFQPFQEGERTISFDVSGLQSSLGRVSEVCNWPAIDAARAKAAANDKELRDWLADFVHHCASDPTEWCWSDPKNYLYRNDQGHEPTRDKALDDAFQYTKDELAFRDEDWQ